MATTRLRKAFGYPGGDDEDDEDDPTPNNMDEEEQEKLITQLRKENDERNRKYERISIAIPLLGIAAFLPGLQSSQLMRAKLVALLAISSLLCTAYVLIFSSKVNWQPTNPRQGKARPQREHGPMQSSMILVNGVMALVVCLHAFTFYGSQGVHEAFWLFCIIPAAALCVILAVRQIMLEVDVAELEELKYQYKGA